MKDITQGALVELLAKRKGNVIAQVLSLTDAKQRKTNNPFGIIRKRSAASISIGTDYEAAVNRVATREGNEQAGAFKAESIWNGKGEHLVPNKVIRHVDKGTLYLYCQSSDKQMDAFPPNVEYRDSQGNAITYDEAKPFLVEATESKKQAEFGNENQRTVRMIALDNVQQIAMDGETYRLVRD